MRIAGTFLGLVPWLAVLVVLVLLMGQELAAHPQVREVLILPR